MKEESSSIFQTTPKPPEIISLPPGKRLLGTGLKVVNKPLKLNRAKKGVK